MKPNYVVRKSKVAALDPILLVLFFLIVPIFIQIVKIMIAKSYSVEFYDDKMVIKSGWLNKQESQSVFMGVYSVSISQSIMGRMFNYGNISVDCPGKWDIDTEGVADPQGLKRYLQSKISSKGAANIIHN